MNEAKVIPCDVLNENLRKYGRLLESDTRLEQRWVNEQFGLQVTWSDGESAFIGMGAIASAVVESWQKKMH